MIGRGDWWAVSAPDRPTFYLDADVQGFTDETGACLVALRVMHGDRWPEENGTTIAKVAVEHLGREFWTRPY